LRTDSLQERGKNGSDQYIAPPPQVLELAEISLDHRGFKAALDQSLVE
jgi:hypothetical protein